MPTALYSHSAIIYKDLIYLVGGMCLSGYDLNLNSKHVEIYNPNNDTYESKQLVQNPYL